MSKRGLVSQSLNILPCRDKQLPSVMGPDPEQGCRPGRGSMNKLRKHLIKLANLLVEDGNAQSEASQCELGRVQWLCKSGRIRSQSRALASPPDESP